MISSSANAHKHYVFLIPNNDKHGAQNFFRRLFNKFPEEKKSFYIESSFSSFRKKFIYFWCMSFKKKMVLFTTVNSNVFGLLLKLTNPKLILISRLGNTISQEIKPNIFNYLKHRIFYKLLLYFTDIFIFQSSKMKEDFLDFFEFVDNKKFKVISNGVEIPKLKRSTIYSQGELKFLLVGSFKFQKGYDIFFNAIAGLSKKLLSMSSFTICGDGVLQDDFREIADRQNYRNIYFKGMTDPTEYYKSCHVYILSSRFEGFSNSLIEALSYGLPSIASDCPGPNSEIINSSNGMLFKNEDSQELANKIEALLKIF